MSSSYSVSKQVMVTVPVTRKVDGVLVDPSAFTFTMQPPVDGGLVYASSTYAWNGSTWTNSESILATPVRLSLGLFRLTIIVPHSNTAKGGWAVDWFHVANLAGDGQGGDSTAFNIAPSSVPLP